MRIDRGPDISRECFRRHLVVASIEPQPVVAHHTASTATKGRGRATRELRPGCKSLTNAFARVLGRASFLCDRYNCPHGCHQLGSNQSTRPSGTLTPPRSPESPAGQQQTWLHPSHVLKVVHIYLHHCLHVPYSRGGSPPTPLLPRRALRLFDCRTPARGSAAARDMCPYNTVILRTRRGRPAAMP